MRSSAEFSTSGCAILGEARLDLLGGSPTRREAGHAVETERDKVGQEAHACRSRADVVVARVERVAQAVRVPPRGLAPRPRRGHELRGLGHPDEGEVELVARNLTARPAVRSRPLPPTMMRDVLLDALGLVVRVPNLGVPALERGSARSEHPGDDLEVVGEDVHPLTDGREAVAVGQPLVLLPAGADAELEAPTADDVEGGAQLRGQGRVAERGAHDHVPEADTRGSTIGHRGQGRERLEGDLIRRARDGVEVVEDPQGLEAERLGVHASSTDRAHAAAASQPSYSPFQPWGIIRPTCIAVPSFVHGVPDRLPRRQGTCAWAGGSNQPSATRWTRGPRAGC